ncbi:unnamed protein product [Urochloa humidicola]
MEEVGRNSPDEQTVEVLGTGIPTAHSSSGLLGLGGGPPLPLPLPLPAIPCIACTKDFLGALLIATVEMAIARPGNARGWFSDDPREAHLDRFYWLLALLCFISFVVFMQLCKYYNGNDASVK